MSIVSYNGITLPYAIATDYHWDAIGDDMGDTDWVYSKLTLSVQTVIHYAYLATYGLNLNTTNPADIQNALHSKLMQRRKTLSYRIGEVETIPQAQTGLSGTVDARNGPIPQRCLFTNLTNTSFLMTYSLIAHYWVNYDTSSSAALVGNPTNLRGNNTAFNRWSESLNMDNKNFITRVREGKFVIRSDNFEGKIASQIIPQMAVVAVPNGYLRDNSSYTIQPNGLALQYKVTDKEQFKMPPEPAYKASGKYTYRSSVKYPIGWGSVDLRLEGSKNTSQTDLLTTCVAICSAKLRCPGSVFLGEGPAPRFTIALMEEVVASVDMYENTVECQMRARLKISNKQRFEGATGDELRKMVFTPKSDNVDYQPQYPVRGTWIPDAPGQSSPGAGPTAGGRLLEAAAYYDPSLTTTVMNGIQMSTGLQVGQAGAVPE